MSVSTILRVKRRLEDNPQDALVLLCKRIKIDTEEVSPSLFVFRGTVNDKETTDVTNIVPKSDIKLKSTPDVNSIIEKLRKERKEASSQSRYEVVNCSRGLKDNSVENEDQFDVVDLKRSDDKEKDVEYAYDLYISAKQDFDISMLDNIVSIEDYTTDLVFGTYRGKNDPGSSSSGAEDDDDSNDENNWRNDYPEESDTSTIDETDMMRAMENCDIGDDLSSDTGEDKIYNDPPDFFTDDAERYGTAYAKYKARVLGEDANLDSKGLVHCVKMKDIDEESVDGYKDDNEDGFYYGEDEDTDQFREQYRQESSDEYSPD